MKLNIKTVRVALITLAIHVVTLHAPAQAQAEQKFFDFPPNSEAVEKAVSAENLRRVAAQTQDADVLLGLAYLARVGDPVRQELAAKAVQANPAYAHAAAVLNVMMEGIDHQKVATLLELDPENALGHYLLGNLQYRSDQDAEAIDSFRKATSQRELRLYLDITADALFKALDALDLRGRDRLAALSWVATRIYNFGAVGIQPLHRALAGLGTKGDPDIREEVSEMLVTFAGHLSRTNHGFRVYGRWSLETAFRIKAELAAEQRSPKMYGYAAVTQALVSTGDSWNTGGDEVNPEETAQFLPTRIHTAFQQTGPREAEMSSVKRAAPEAERPAFEAARQDGREAAEALIEAAMKDPDAIVGAYLRGIPGKLAAEKPWQTPWTRVHVAMQKHPEVLRAAMRYEQTHNALNAFARHDPKSQNFSRMMRIGQGIFAYAMKHDRQYPPSLEVLYEQKLVEAEVEPRSVHTGRPYVYVAAGERLPEKSHIGHQFIVLYDDHEMDGMYQCVMADGHGEHVPVERVREQLKARGK